MVRFADRGAAGSGPSERTIARAASDWQNAGPRLGYRRFGLDAPLSVAVVRYSRLFPIL